ncbi:glycosyltransferase family 29 protein [Methylorubrum salsuginis]|uniref:Glycosyltransferase family 29 (Sialyltransferase) n=1 Tax=Methylorubrum salsuginis TaxID=414703 RepID=A0A1I4H991_9HYPH|nr:glycosyltransferase family 29 protein [Methylorubrum salsuginis]SFL38735.1 Glycosyltransferase family 29 (sialyltransferase) [Methylorubrum salsuginis]
MSVLSDWIIEKGSSDSIAIVGNAPKILEREDGALIDAHSTVIRINDGRSVGFEKHCGAKTDIRFVGIPIKERYRKFFTDLREPSLLVTRRANKIVLDELGHDGDSVYIDDYSKIINSALPTLSKFVSIAEIPAKPPRTGIVITSLLAPLFGKSKITLFGFETDLRVTGLEHYYNDGRVFQKVVDNWQSHCPMEFEFGLLHDLQARNYIDIR